MAPVITSERVASALVTEAAKGVIPRIDRILPPAP